MAASIDPNRHATTPAQRMKPAHRIIFFLIALLALGTFVFGILQLLGAGGR
jgi:hypothetical protein